MQDQFKNYPKDYISNLKNAIKAAEKELDALPDDCNCDGPNYRCKICTKSDELITGIMDMKEEAGLI